MSGLVLVLLLDIVVTASVLLLYAFSEGFHSTMTEIFNSLVNGLCWLTDHTWGRAVRARARRRELAVRTEEDETAKRIAWLEHVSDQWHEIRMSGREPVWTDFFGWITSASVCSCGYIEECRTWCGDGHVAGACPGHTGEYIRIPKEAVTDREAVIRFTNPALDILRRTGMTAEEWVATVRQSLKDAGGAL